MLIMLKGIDISSWQENIDLLGMPIDFVIVKATEGTGYVNPYCDPKVQQAKKIGLKWGFYHYLTIGNESNAVNQADYFYENCKNYFNEGIPCVDWEGKGSPSGYYGSGAVNAFVRRIHDLTGVWPLIYSWPSWFNNGGVESNCGRWIASYPSVTNPSLDYDPGEVPATDGLVAMWQFASDGRVNGYNGNLDLNHFFGDRFAWDAYAHASSVSSNDDKNNEVSVLENDDYIVTVEKK
jgi:GH25 family lysozyme M1 (1,4-beta-N-acetylmuramidase)